MRIHVHTFPSRLEFRHPFRIAHGVRTGTDVVLVRLEWNDLTAFGEATLPPYLMDTIESVTRFFSLPEIQNIAFPISVENLFDELHRSHPANMPAKAALDMALWQLLAKYQRTSLNELLKISSQEKIPHSYTIAVGNSDEMKEKFAIGLENNFRFFKLKLDGIHDEQIIDDYCSLTSLPFAVDANQSWRSVEAALKISEKLIHQGCVLIEQPFDKHDLVMSRALKEAIDIPVIADEACQLEVDIDKLSASFSGVNIKLQKCGGITPALRMIHRARELNLKVLIGCMSESSIGCNAAEVLTPLCDWADLDGPFLIRNNEEILMLAESFSNG